MLPFLCRHFRFRGLRFWSSLKAFKFTIAVGVVHGLMFYVVFLVLTYSDALNPHLLRVVLGLRPLWRE